MFQGGPMSNVERSYKTAARAGITEYLKTNADRTVTVGDIMKGLGGEGRGINVSTVYRYLSKLSEEGLVNKYVAGKGEMAVYQYAGASHNCSEHIHLQCRVCGRVIHLDCGFMDEIRSHILEHHGFGIECKGSILYGICEECSRTDTESKEGSKE